MPTCNVITPVHVLGSFVHSRPLIHSFGNLKEKEAIDLKKKKVGGKWVILWYFIFLFLNIRFKAKEDTCLSKRNSNKLRTSSDFISWWLCAIPLPPLPPSVFEAKMYSFFRMELKCHFLANFAWSSSCNHTQWLRMFLLSPQALLHDCYRAHLIVWMAVTWLLIKLGVPTMSFIFMWLEAHKVTLSPYP